jgi:hypothetical protein
MRLSLLSDIGAMMIPKAYLFLSDCRSAAATGGTVTPSRPRKKHVAVNIAKLLSRCRPLTGRQFF